MHHEANERCFEVLHEPVVITVHELIKIMHPERVGVFVQRDSRGSGSVVVLPDLTEISEQTLLGTEQFGMMIQCRGQPSRSAAGGTDDEM